MSQPEPQPVTPPATVEQQTPPAGGTETVPTPGEVVEPPAPAGAPATVAPFKESAGLCGMADGAATSITPTVSASTLEACKDLCAAEAKCTNASFGKDENGQDQCSLYQATDPMIGSGEEGGGKCFLKNAAQVNIDYAKAVADAEA